VSVSSLTPTFLMTDIEGSTRLWEEHGDAMAAALQEHDALLKAAIADSDGTIIKTTGDGLLAVFTRPEAALRCALDTQAALTVQSWPSIGRLRVRMALHAGAAQLRDSDYFGPTINRVARLLGIGHGGQILVSGSAAALARQSLPIGVELLDLGEQRLRDLERPEHVYQLVAVGLDQTFPTLRSLTPERTNLPSQPSEFVGRQRELSEVRSLAASHRIVTLIGAGGTGKSRLMLQAGAELLDQYADGVWLVELATVSDPDLLVQQVALALGLSEEPGRALAQTLVDFLQPKTLLLLIDNCEHLIGSAAGLVEKLIAHCPTLSVLASSREALGIDGEVVFQVPSLSLPPSSEPHDEGEDWFAEMSTTEAVELFLERAKAARPSFALTPQNAHAVAEICQRLDGIPLALELAAGRLSVLSVQEIAERLGDRFRLLTGGRRTALPRQQTLQALIDWSWALLTTDDQRLLAGLSVFAGGCTLEAAAAVTLAGAREPRTVEGGYAAGQLDAIDGLSRLVDRSLVIADAAESTRYRMLETIRQYGRERLIESGDADQIRGRHMVYFRDLALQAEPALFGRESVTWLKRLDLELGNLRAARDWALEAAPEDAVRMSVALLPYWRSRAMGSEAIEWSRRAAAAARSLPPPDPALANDRDVLIARALAGAAQAHASWSTPDTAVSYGREAVDIARRSGDDYALSQALGAMGLALVFSGDDAGIRELAAEAVEVARRAEDWWTLGMVQAGMAAGAAAMGDLEAAVGFAASANEAAARSGNVFLIAFNALSRGRVAGYAGRPSEVRAAFAQATRAYEELGDSRFALISKSDFGHALRHIGSLTEAEATYRQTLPGWHRLGSPGAIANQLESFAFLAISAGNGSRACRLLGAAAAVRKGGHAPMAYFERAGYEREVAVLRTLVDPATFDAAWAEGGRLGTEGAVALALESTAGDAVQPAAVSGAP
jgi:predicted ATPase/class 3 adenylate cyclase